ncbi:discoidin domain-containing protein [Novipirellula artificiosorum]|nr:discoidin domain-containing protein [Novipirellula artificiosorum]
MRSRFCLLAMLGACMLGTQPCSRASEPAMDLSGQWQVLLDHEGTVDPGDVDPSDDFQPVTLPGTLRDQGLGDPVGPDTQWIGGVKTELWNQPKYARYRDRDHFKMPFWWQPERHFVGTAWYRRSVDVPAAWNGKRILLELERPHWMTTLFVDGQQVGQGDSLGTPHRFDLSDHLAPGEHTLTLGVNNSLNAIDVGLNSHSVSDHTQTAWHGIVGAIELRAEPKVAIEKTQIFPSKQGRSVRLKIDLVNATEQRRNETISVKVAQDDRVLGERVFSIDLAVGTSSFDGELQFTETPRRWDEFSPSLCHFTATIESTQDVYEDTFGVRSIETANRQLVLNGKPIFLRGSLECCIFPLTGYPPTDLDSWTRIIRICKEHGLNHLRFHSWCPPKAAFVAADELGFYFQVECSTWPNASTKLGVGEPIDTWLYRETERVLSEYGNHPSFLLLASGNEPAGAERGGKFLGPWVTEYKMRDDRRLFTSGSGWPSIDENQYHVTPSPRIQQWGEGLSSRINAKQPETITDYQDFVSRYQAPVVSHEIGQWCVYPNFDEMKKYGGSLKLRNFEVFRDFLDEAKMLDQAEAFLMASGKLQVLCYKEEIESALRTATFGGFQLLDMRDFPGQGTALVGMLDPFWDSKPYLTPEQFRRFCGPIVPLARMQKRTWRTDETFTADLEVSHYGPETLVNAEVRWTITAEGKTVASGSLAPQTIQAAGLRQLGRIEVLLSECKEAANLNLEVTIDTPDGPIANDWNIWVYSEQVDASNAEEVLVVHALDEEATSHLRHGGKVVLLANPRTVKTDVELGFSSIFWNTAWTGGQAPQTLGVLCDPAHPALARFPTESHSDWQWWELIHGAATMEMDSLPDSLRPMIQVVPDWFAPQRLGLAFEAKVEGGKLLVCSMDLQNDLDHRPVAKQMRASLMGYVNGDEFQPAEEVTADQVRELFRELSPLEKLFPTISVDSHQAGYGPEMLIDGDASTMWHTAWSPSPEALPHWLMLDLHKPITVAGIRAWPRRVQDNGRIKGFEVLVSSDAKHWQQVAAGTWPNDAAMKVVAFDEPHTFRYLKLIASEEVNGKAFTSLAEIDLDLVASE